LALTFIIDWIGVRVAPDLYLGQPWFAGDRPILRYLASLLMLQEVWHLRLVPGINGPFWSLSYEAIYYLAFGIIFFTRHALKWLAVALLLALAGPVVTALFPIWGLGFFAYKFCKSKAIPESLCYVLAISGLFLLAASPFVRSLPSIRFQIMGEEILGRYIDGLAFFMHLIGIYGLTTSLPKLPIRFRSVISTVAATTFPLYLLHRPLIQFFSYAGPDDPSSWQRRALLIFGTLIFVFFATPPIEKLRLVLRAKLIKLFEKGRSDRQRASMPAKVKN
jgi:peptidoglycan/LPS O-acetylase OafA/YrhL